jgi:hypothetical protein
MACRIGNVQSPELVVHGEIAEVHQQHIKTPRVHWNDYDWGLNTKTRKLQVTIPQHLHSPTMSLKLKNFIAGMQSNMV